MSDAPAPSPDDWEGLAANLRALANPKRLHLVRYLEEPRSAEEIASELGLARQTALEHLKHLVDSGIVERKPARGAHGAVMEYVVNPQRLFAIHEAFGGIGIFDSTTDPLRHPTERLDGAATATTEAPPVRLVVVHGMRIGRAIPLRGEGPWLIGRDPGSTLAIDYDPYVSGRHAEIRRNGPGYLIADAFSSNGTLVDGKRIPRGGTMPAENGTILTVGRTTLVFRTK